MRYLFLCVCIMLQVSTSLSRSCLRRQCVVDPYCIFRKRKCNYSHQYIALVGNSFLKGNKLPALFQTFIGDEYKIISLSKPAFTLSAHASDVDVTRALLDDRIKHIIFQGQSQELSFGDGFTFRYVIPPLCDMTAQTSATTHLMQTWGYVHGNGVTDSFLEMSYRIHDGYKLAGSMCNSDVIDVGSRWVDMYNSIDQNLDGFSDLMYADDGIHPSSYGTVLNALSLYHGIFPDRELPRYRKRFQRRWNINERLFEYLKRIVLT